MDAAPAPDVAAAHVRPTARPRPWVTPFLVDDGSPGHPPDDPAVRRFWTAVVGPGAVADLLRLTAAAVTGRRIREPTHLTVLAREGLCHRHRRLVLLRPRVLHLSPRHLGVLSPALRLEYRSLLKQEQQGT